MRLFVDRLDGLATSGQGGETERLAPYAKQLVQMRNRVYFPGWGRFAQRDPNATAAVLIGASAHHGREIGAIVDAFDLEGMHGDGANLYGYLGGNSWRRCDPLGTDWWDQAINVYSTIGVTAGQVAYRLGKGYAENMDFDAEWASDWTLPDDMHSRMSNAWIDDIYTDADIDFEVNSFPAYAFAGKGGTVVNLVHNGIKITRKASRFLHHVLPKYLGRILGQSSKVLAAIPRALHQPYHNYVSRGMHEAEDLMVGTMRFPHMNAPIRVREAWINECRRAGIFDSVMRDRIVGNLRRLTSEFSITNHLGGLVEALDDVLKELSLLER
jgi:hypothetical protein